MGLDFSRVPQDQISGGAVSLLNLVADTQLRNKTTNAELANAIEAKGRFAEGANRPKIKQQLLKLAADLKSKSKLDFDKVASDLSSTGFRIPVVNLDIAAQLPDVVENVRVFSDNITNLPITNESVTPTVAPTATISNLGFSPARS